MTKIASLLAILFILSIQVLAQKEKSVEYSSQPEQLLKSIRLPENVKDSLSLHKTILGLRAELQSMGYLLPEIILEVPDTNHYKVQVNAGTRYELAFLDPGNLPEIIQSRVGYRDKFFRATPFDFKEIQKLFQRIIEYAEDNGYPFASVGMDSVIITNGAFSGVINYDPGPLITYDSLHVRGNLKIKPRFLSAYLQVREGTPYSQKRSNRIQGRLAALSYLKVNSPVTTSFQNLRSTHYLDLSYQKVNQVDGIIGFLPNEREGNKLLITGEFNLGLHNLFQSGKSLQMEWRSLRPESQYLNMEYDHPFIFRTPIGLHAGFNLLKEDSSFLNRNFRIEANYTPGSYSRLKFFTEFKNSGLLSSEEISNPEGSLELADFEITLYGLGYSLDNTSNLIFPRRGWKLDVEGYLGNKRIVRNSDIDEAFYDSLDLKSTQYYLTLTAHNYQQLGKRSVLQSRVSAGRVDNDQLFLNDLFRLGGLRSLRGFNERDFFASDYLILSAEWRYLLDQNSYFLVFYDQGFMRYDLEETSYRDEPSGIGAGVSLNTGAGVFNLVYALGRTRDQAFAFNLSKIHFGYISRF